MADHWRLEEQPTAMHAFVSAVTLVANIGCSIGKLYPAHYVCETWQCDRLAHNGVMTFTAGAVDLIERYWFLKVLIPDEENSKLLGCIPIGGQHRLLQKIAQLSVSFVWTATDLQEVAVASPGTGTLLIGAFACVLQLVLMCFDVRAAWLTEKLNKEEEAKRGQRESGQIQAGLGFPSLA
jgi:hypothetical protein